MHTIAVQVITRQLMAVFGSPVEIMSCPSHKLWHKAMYYNTELIPPSLNISRLPLHSTVCFPSILINKLHNNNIVWIVDKLMYFRPHLDKLLRCKLITMQSRAEDAYWMRWSDHRGGNLGAKMWNSLTTCWGCPPMMSNLRNCQIALRSSCCRPVRASCRNVPTHDPLPAHTQSLHLSPWLPVAKHVY